jgi:hypothetical protein
MIDAKVTIVKRMKIIFLCFKSCAFLARISDLHLNGFEWSSRTNERKNKPWKKQAEEGSIQLQLSLPNNAFMSRTHKF